MPITKEEIEVWHRAKLESEFKPPLPLFRREPITECIICGTPFGFCEGMITDEVSFCYICDDD